LVVPGDGSITRTVGDWRTTGPYLRLHVGLEDPSDLIADLEAGLARLIKGCG
ncbi:MAG: cystathionine beta-lyase, partial [Alphaproteobacteria bacterium]|nr:cystathionine beta-lyase [Alphaproteobacteria bacterium]